MAVNVSWSVGATRTSYRPSVEPARPFVRPSICPFARPFIRRFARPSVRPPFVRRSGTQIPAQKVDKRDDATRDTKLIGAKIRPTLSFSFSYYGSLSFSFSDSFSSSFSSLSTCLSLSLSLSVANNNVHKSFNKHFTRALSFSEILKIKMFDPENVGLGHGVQHS